MLIKVRNLKIGADFLWIGGAQLDNQQETKLLIINVGITQQYQAHTKSK